MYLKLRVIFTILSALCVAIVVPVGLAFGFVWAGICAVGAFLFFVIMKICKTNQEIQEIRKNATDNTDSVSQAQTNDCASTPAKDKIPSKQDDIK